ncbi:MAG: S-methyl-5-thioribose-1-phosphate isomerase [Bacillota bacterium]|nr:S-methyl-5-thioribose-1-phosphate isomerase [Bacillota bacterium]
MNYRSSIASVQAVALDDENNSLVILDQTLLPNEKKYISLSEQKDIWEAIYSLRVRGAPAIGIAAAYGAYLGIKASKASAYGDLLKDFTEVKNYLASSRPTAVNLFWALNRMELRLKMEKGKSADEIKSALKDEAESIRKEDEEVCKAIGKFGLTLLKPGWGILTHCNAGTIATSRYGTALAPVYLGEELGYNFKVFADETRPLLQGARLTAWELKEAGIDVTLICDNMASIIMKEGKIQAVLVGCDRVAANGDTANKIGTSGVAVLAKYYGIPFYVCAPMSTIDLNCNTGRDIHIELRPDDEITEKWYSRRMAPEGVKVYNPCFDVTDNQLITAIITQKGIIYPPFSDNLASLFKEQDTLGKEKIVE